MLPIGMALAYGSLVANLCVWQRFFHELPLAVEKACAVIAIALAALAIPLLLFGERNCYPEDRKKRYENLALRVILLLCCIVTLSMYIIIFVQLAWIRSALLLSVQGYSLHAISLSHGTFSLSSYTLCCNLDTAPLGWYTFERNQPGGCGFVQCAGRHANRIAKLRCSRWN